ncbi:hypothetical protein C6H69_02315 [Photorhabdus luminescens]|nr:hypothetical protein C6H69_02315 [Photorhabdus luminescens]
MTFTAPTSKRSAFFHRIGKSFRCRYKMLPKEILYPDLEKQIREIYKTHTIPTYTPGDWNSKRWQRKEWPSALNFNFGDGRYNSPDNSFRVCYMADRAVTALAESYGRLWHKEGLRFIDESEIRIARICNIRSLRKLIFIDIAKLIGMLHIPLSVMVDEDYSVTKRAMACLYELLNNEMDGICYISRHWPTDFCYAVWEKREDRFVDAGMQSLVNYRDSEYMPSTWNEPDISADELLEEVLNFKIIRLE